MFIQYLSTEVYRDRQLFVKIIQILSYITVIVNCLETSSVISSSRYHPLWSPNVQSNTGSIVTKSESSEILTNKHTHEENWPVFFPRLDKIEKIISLVEDVQAGNYYRPSSSNYPHTLKFNSTSTIIRPVYNPTKLEKSATIDHRFGLLEPPLSIPTIMNYEQRNDYRNNAKSEEESTEDPSKEEEEEENESEGDKNSSKSKEAEEVEDEKKSEEEYKKEEYTESPSDTKTEEVTTTTLAPFTLSDIVVPTSFLRIEYMIGYAFLGLMYGLGFFVLFQSICVPVAKFFVFVSYLWAVYWGIKNPITNKIDAMQYLPPN